MQHLPACLVALRNGFLEEFDKGIRIERADMLTINTPVDDLLENYRRMFSKIEIAPAGLKL